MVVVSLLQKMSVSVTMSDIYFKDILAEYIMLTTILILAESFWHSSYFFQRETASCHQRIRQKSLSKVFCAPKTYAAAILQLLIHTCAKARRVGLAAKVTRPLSLEVAKNSSATHIFNFWLLLKCPPCPIHLFSAQGNFVRHKRAVLRASPSCESFTSKSQVCYIWQILATPFGIICQAYYRSNLKAGQSKAQLTLK